MRIIPPILLFIFGLLFLWISVDTFLRLPKGVEQFSTIESYIVSLYIEEGVRNDRYFAKMAGIPKDIEIGKRLYRKFEERSLPVDNIKIWHEPTRERATSYSIVQMSENGQIIYSFSRWKREQIFFGISMLFFGIWTPWYARRKIIEQLHKQREDRAHRKVYDLYNK